MKPKNRVTFNREYCKGCGLCVSVCPANIIALSLESINKRGYHITYIDEMDLCIGCLNCAVICPDSVIEIERCDSNE